MKVFNTLVVSSVMAVLAGLLYWRAGLQSIPSSAEFAAEVSQAKQGFLKTISPLASLSVGDLRHNRADRELSDPETILPQTYRFPFEEISSLSSYAKSCQNLAAVRLGTADLKKALLWHRFLCDDLKTLPINFFETKPYMHPSGNSYAALAKASGRQDFNDLKWQRENSLRQHLAEALSESGLRISGLDMQRLLRGDDLVLTSDFVVIASPRSGELNPEI